jgi:hypothetical protein
MSGIKLTPLSKVNAWNRDFGDQDHLQAVIGGNAEKG